MIKRNVKRALSVILSIVLMFTTFFIFDPDVLKIDTGAYVATTEPTLANDDVFFYVPEVIYLTPSTAGEDGTVPFKWFADRENADNGEITKSVADKTAGSVYFHCVIAESYIINVSLPDGCSISNVDTGTWTSGNSYSTNQMTGSALNKQGQTITWTLTWSDGTRNYTTTRYSRIYKTNYVPSGGAGRTVRGSSSIVRVIGAVYINGFANTFTGGNKNMKDEYNTALNPNWQRSSSSGWNEIQKYMDSASSGSILYNERTTEEPVNDNLSGLNLFIDRSRYTNYNQIPNLIYTIAITGQDRNTSERWAGISYDYEHGDDNRAGVCNVFSVPADTAETKVYTGRINAATPAASTSPSSHYFYGAFHGRGGNGEGWTRVWINFNAYSYDKSSLRNAYDYAVKSSKYLQPQWYTDSVWSAYTTAFNNVADVLISVEDTNAANYADLANTLTNQVNTMKNAFTGAIYKDGIVRSGTVTVHHKYVTGGSGSSITSTATVSADETLTYYYGENVVTGFNDLSSSPDSGYVNLGYASGNFSSGTLTLGTGNNTYTFVETPSLECTYVYLKKSLVTFDANGGSCSTSNKTVTYSDAYGDLPTTTREGYTFNGWYTSTSGGSQITASTTAWLLEDQTIYAQWTPNTYTVNFDPNGGSCDTANMTVTYDSPYGALPTPTRTGYSFSGWYTAAIGGTLIDADTKVQNTTTQTLYAHWTATSYTVTFNANGGSCDTANKSVTYNSAYGTLPTATRTGYSFNGWYTVASGGNKVSETTKVTTMSDHTLYAQWTATSYTVTFNANGGSCDTASKSVVYDSAYGTLPTASRTGYTFTGWFTAESGGSKVDETTTVGNASNHTLYAQWSANSYTVTFNANGGSCGTANKSVTFDSAYGALPTAARTGYTFSGWYTAETSGSKVEESTVVKTADNHTVYARWSASSYTVTFDANGGSCGTKSKSVVFDSTYGSLPTASRTGYTFTGWFTEASDGSLVDATTVVNTASDHTVYAHWSANSYTLTFITNGGYCATSVMSVTYDSTYGVLPIATRAGYNFEGWFTEISGGSRVVETTVVTTTSDQTVYAQWTANSYTVYFSPNGGSCSTASKVVTFDSTYGELPTATKTGYNFTGWYTSEIGGTKCESSTLVKTAKDHILHAHWTANYYIAYFDANGGSCSTTHKIVVYNSAYGELPTATKSGCTFDGWFTAASGGTKIDASSLVATANEHTLYAHWTANTYTVNFNANGGTCDTASKTVTLDSEYGDLPTANRSGYTFNGWFTATSGGTKIESGTKVQLTSTQTLYAQWTANDYTVTFNANGGSVSPESKTVTFDSAYGELPTATKSGYTFDGWFTVASGGTKIDASSLVATANEHTLYAHWSANSHFNPKGTCVIDGSYIYGLKTKLTSSALKNTYLDYENVELTIENPTGGRYLGTGSTVTVEYPDGTTEVYTIVIFGDVDGDGNITADDSASLKSYINGTSSEDFTAAQKKASNLDGSRRIDVDDFSMLSSAASGAIELNQADPSESK